MSFVHLFASLAPPYGITSNTDGSVDISFMFTVFMVADIQGFVLERVFVSFSFDTPSRYNSPLGSRTTLTTLPTSRSRQSLVTACTGAVVVYDERTQL